MENQSISYIDRPEPWSPFPDELNTPGKTHESAILIDQIHEDYPRSYLELTISKNHDLKSNGIVHF